jgi:undecaprenyl pyrophosphate synthase
LEQFDVKVNFLGQLDLLPEDVRQAVEELAELTKDHTR